MFDFLRIAGRCMKSHRLAAYIVGCVTLIVITVSTLYIADKCLNNFTQYKDFSINLFHLIEIEVSR